MRLLATTVAMRPEFADLKNLKVLQTIGVILVHGGAIAAPLYFSWHGFWLCVFLVFITGQFGIGLGFHRLLAHKSFETTKMVRRLLVLLGTLALQAGPISWVTVHRIHHRHADSDKDPHSPTMSFVWAYFEWALFSDPNFNQGLKMHWAKDVIGDPVIRFLEERQDEICLLSFALLFALGVVFGDVRLGWSIFLWAGCVRIVYLWHTVFIINSIGHLWGYRNYKTNDNSQNSLFVSLLAFGDGWQNNHHAFPRSANFSHRHFEIDPLYWVIRMFKAVGLFRNVVTHSVPSENSSFVF
jgi:fatty-acid desaturase